MRNAITDTAALLFLAALAIGGVASALHLAAPLIFPHGLNAGFAPRMPDTYGCVRLVLAAVMLYSVSIVLRTLARLTLADIFDILRGVRRCDAWRRHCIVPDDRRPEHPAES